MGATNGHSHDGLLAPAATVPGAFAAADFALDLRTGAVQSTSHLNALLGYEQLRTLTRDDFYARVHPDDASALRAIESMTPGQGEPCFEREFRVVLPDGSVRWVHARGEVVFADRVASCLRGTCFDITDRKRSEEAARESESRYRALTQLSPSAILVACGGRYVYANDAAARLLRAASPRELAGRELLELLAPEYHDLIRLRIQHILEQRTEVERVRYRWLRLDRSVVDVEVAAAWVQWSGEDAVQIVAHDITNEVLVEEALRESRAQLADELEDARRLHAVSTRLIQTGDTLGLQRALLQEAIHLTRADFGSVQEADLECHELRLIVHRGLDPESARYWAVVPHDTGACGGQAVGPDERVVVEDVEACEFMAGTRDLEEFRRCGIRAVQSTPLRARDGRLVGMMSTHWSRPHRPSGRELRLLDVLARQAADLIELHRSQERLAAEERRKSFLLDLNDRMRRLTDARQIQLQAASMLGEHLGASRAGYAEDRGDDRTFVVLAHYTAPGVRGVDGIYRYDSYPADLLRTLRSGRPVFGPKPGAQSAAHEAVRSAHRALEMAATLNVPLLRDGQLVAMLFLHFREARAWSAEDMALVEAVAARTWDAVERARAETALRESEARLAVVFETLPVGVGLLDTAGRLVVSNPEMRRFLPTGLIPSRDDERRNRWRAYGTDGRLLDSDEYPAARALRGDEVVPGIEMGCAQDDGTEVWARVAAMPIRDSRGRITGAVAVVMEAEQALRASEQRFRALVDNVRDYAIFMLDVDGRVVEWSDGAARVTGYAASEALGRHVSVFYTPEDQAAGEVQQDLDEAERVGRAEREGWRVCKDGKRIWVNEISTEVRGADGVLRGFTRISRDLTERRRTEQALAEAARHKDEFLAMLSHELRNPLAPIRNSVYLLRHVPGDSKAGHHAQNVIERQTQHLSRIVDDLLDVTRIARGKIELRKSPVELRELVRRAGEDLRSVLEGHGVRFDLELPAGKAWCEADATRLHQAIGNLLSNAAKFTREGDRVLLALSVGEGQAQVRVSDTGRGIEPALLQHLFEPFVQGDRTLARSQGGLGLGLALVRGIVEMHGGRVTAASAGTGRGAEFGLSLPLLNEEPLPAAPETPVRNDGPRLRVLVVDDNVDAAESLAAIVALLGHTTDLAFDGPEALAKARAFRPDVVLCDIGLPRMSGYEVARTLREDPEFAGRLIAVSGYAQPDDIRKGVAAGFDAHLAKPFDPAQLAQLFV